MWGLSGEIFCFLNPGPQKLPGPGSVGSVGSVESVDSVQSVKSVESVQSDISQCKSVRYFVQTVCTSFTSVLAHLRVDFRAFFC